MKIFLNEYLVLAKALFIQYFFFIKKIMVLYLMSSFLIMTAFVTEINYIFFINDSGVNIFTTIYPVVKNIENLKLQEYLTIFIINIIYIFSFFIITSVHLKWLKPFFTPVITYYAYISYIYFELGCVYIFNYPLVISSFINNDLISYIDKFVQKFISDKLEKGLYLSEKVDFNKLNEFILTRKYTVKSQEEIDYLLLNWLDNNLIFVSSVTDYTTYLFYGAVIIAAFFLSYFVWRSCNNWSNTDNHSSQIDEISESLRELKEARLLDLPLDNFYRPENGRIDIISGDDGVNLLATFKKDNIQTQIDSLTQKGRSFRWNCKNFFPTLNKMVDVNNNIIKV